MKDLFAIEDVPFSYHESWISIAVPRRNNEEKLLWFRNHHSAPNNVFKLIALADGEPVKPGISTEPWALTLSHGHGVVEICFESPTTVRMRGRGLSIQLGEQSLIYSEEAGTFVINARGAFRRYGVQVLKGSFDIKRKVPTQPMFPCAGVISAGSGEYWEIAVDEFWSTWVRPERKSFDECLAAAKKSFSDFVGAMPEVDEKHRKTHALACYINWSCTVGPCGHIKRPSLLMSKQWMSNVWSWDHCFNGMALAKGHPGLAIDQMLTMVDHQDEFGCYPDSVNDTWMHFNFAKPPVHGWAFRDIMERMPQPPSADTVRTMYDSLSAQVNWWMSYRCKVPGIRCQDKESSYRSLPYYLHGNDSGWDNSTMFDFGVPLVAPDLSALLVVQMDVLSGIASDLEKEDEAREWKVRADALFALLMKELWAGDHFVAKLANDGAVVESQSLIPWLGMIMGDRLPRDVQEHMKAGIESHLTEWGLATERTDSPKYNSNGYWRGPIWGPSTVIAVTGLERCGFHDLARDIAARFSRLCDKSGFAENYDAVSGASLCDPAYTWTASAYLLLLERL